MKACITSYKHPCQSVRIERLSNRSALTRPLLHVSLTTARARSAARRRSTERPNAPRDTDAGQPAAGTARWSIETARISPPQLVSRSEWEAVLTVMYRLVTLFRTE